MVTLLLPHSVFAQADTLSFGTLTLVPKAGNHEVPLTLLSAPEGGGLPSGKLLGLSLSTRGAQPWTMTLGRLEPGTSTAAAPTPGLLAVSGTLPGHQRFSIAPRLLLPVQADNASARGIGATLTSTLTRRISFVSDVGAASEPTTSGWEPVVAGRVNGAWTRTTFAASVVRNGGGRSATGTRSGRAEGTVSAKLQPVAGLWLSGRGRSAAAATGQPSSGSQSLELGLGRLAPGVVTAGAERERTGNRSVFAHRVEWQPASGSALVLRFRQERVRGERATPIEDVSRALAVEAPLLSASNRVDVRAAFTAQQSRERTLVGSRVQGRVAVGGSFGVIGETELALGGPKRAQVQQPAVRTLSVTSQLARLNRMALQLRYTYRATLQGPEQGQGLEARLSPALF